jgi:hypothetical protein
MVKGTQTIIVNKCQRKWGHSLWKVNLRRNMIEVLQIFLGNVERGSNVLCVTAESRVWVDKVELEVADGICTLWS